LGILGIGDALDIRMDVDQPCSLEIVAVQVQHRSIGGTAARAREKM
jgi:hypothetical protein